MVQGEPAPYCSAAPGDQARLKPPNAPAPEQKLPLCWSPGGLSAQVGGPVCLQELGRTRRSIETVSHQAPGAFTAERRGISVLTWSSSSATSWPSDRGTTFKVPELGSTRRNNSRDHSWGRAPRGLLAAGSWRRGPLHLWNVSVQGRIGQSQPSSTMNGQDFMQINPDLGNPFAGACFRI